MRGFQVAASLLAGGLIFAACGGAAVPGDAGRIDPDLVANLHASDARSVGEAVNAFGFDLFHELTDGSGNTVISPPSAATMLAMALAGAGSETAQAMAQVLHLDESRDVRVGALLGRLADTGEVTLSVSNALWAHEGTAFEDDYLEFVHDTFGGTLEEGDLGADATAEAIDDWVRDGTQGLVEGIADDLGLPSPNVILVLLNAVYFHGDWSTPFDPGETRDEAFQLADGTRTDVPLMRLRKGSFGYAERDGYRMLRLPYGEDGRYGMEIVVPDDGVALGPVLKSMDGAEWASAVASLDEREVDEVVVPRFELEWDDELTAALAQLGMGQAFEPGADFRPMSPAAPWLDTVVHKTYIRVDEEGTEAAAVSGGNMAVSGRVDADPVVFRVDRPFVFTVSDTETGTVLFLGAVADPRA